MATQPAVSESRSPRDQPAARRPLIDFGQFDRGEVTAVVAIAALTFTIFRGLIDKPGAPCGETGTGYGWFVALAGGLLVLVGSVWRSRDSGARRKPPGVL